MSSSLEASLLFDSPWLPPLRKRVLGWLGIAAIHLAIIASLWYSPERASLQPAKHAMMVSFVAERTPVAVQQPQPVQPVVPVPIKPAPKMIATPDQASTAAITVPPELHDDAVHEAPLTTPAQPAVVAPATSAKEESVVPPDYLAAYLNNPGPPYPNASRRRREEGVVTLKVLVSATGSPEQVLIDSGSGFPDLDKAASSIVKERWRFVPARQRDVAVQAWVLVPISFTLKPH